MATNTTLAGLSQTAASNGPDGTTDAPSTLDDAIRYALSFIAILRDAGHVYATGVAGTNTVTGSLLGSPTSYATGQSYSFIPAVTNTAATTLNLSSIGAKSIFRNGTALVGGELVASVPAVVLYDGTQFNLISTTSVTSGNSVASTSGTAINFTGIPAWVKRITMNFAGVSTNGTSYPIVQLGISTGIDAAGYLCSSASVINAASPSTVLYTTGFGIPSGGAANIFHGSLVLSLLDSATNTWCASGNISASNAAAVFPVGGSKALSGTLDRVRFTTVAGVDTFDAGLVNIMYE